MTDVFISYSRKDKEFVRRLHDALAAAQKDVWVDWEDIPLASDWKAEISSGIEGADSFIFVLSPDSAISEVCGQELEHAVQNHKRLVPILYRDGDYKNIPTAVSAHNWVYFRETDNWDTALNSVLTTLDTDLDYIKMHTRLLVRAREWDTNKRNPSFVLRGADLQSAEQWHLTSAERKPAATALHHEYINASRKAAASRLRVIIAGLLAGIVVAIFLLIIAIIQSNRATQNEQVALSNLQHAESLRLAANADNLIQSYGDPQLIMLLAIRALKADYTEGADLALQQGFTRQPIQRVFAGHTQELLKVAFSPDNRLILSGAFDNSAILWDASTGQPLRQFGHSQYVGSLAFSPDGTKVLTGSADYVAHLWDIATGKEVKQFIGHTGDIQGVAFLPDGKTILTSGNDGSARLWDVASGNQIGQLAPTGFTVNQVDVSPDGKLGLTVSLTYGMVEQPDLSYLQVWDLATGQVLPEFAQIEGVKLAKFSSDGTTLLVSTESETRGLDLATGKETFHISSPVAAFSPDGKFGLVTTTNGPTQQIVELNTGKMIFQKNLNLKEARDVAFSSDDAKLLSTSGNNLLMWNLQYDDATQNPAPSASIAAIAISRDQQQVFAGSVDGFLRVWNVQTQKLAQQSQPCSSYLAGVALTLDSKVVLSCSFDKVVLVQDIATGNVVQRLTFDADTGPVAVSPDGNLLLVGFWDNSIRLMDLQTGKELRRLIGHQGVVQSVAFSPDGRQAISGGGDFTARVWDLNTGAELQKFVTSGQAVVSVAFSPDGQDILTTSATGQVWNLQQHRQITEFTRNGAYAYSAAFSPDGKLIVSSGSDTTIRVWDAASGNELRQLTGGQGGAASLSISPDGKFIAYGDAAGSLYAAPVDYRDLVSVACKQLTRDFTDDERVTYEITDHEPTCSGATSALTSVTPVPTRTIAPAWPIPAEPSLVATFTDTPTLSPLGLTITAPVTPTPTRTIPVVTLAFSPVPTRTPAP